MKTSTKWMMPLLACLLIQLLPMSFAHGQETMCVTKSDFREAVHAECKDHKARADQYGNCRDLLTAQTRAKDICAGQLQVLDAVDLARIDAERRATRAEVERYSVWTVGTTGVVGIVVGAIVALLVVAD